MRDAEIGEGYIHFFPTITTDYFEELTAERQVLRYKNGYQERIWVKKSSARNEALDEAVYAWAAFLRFQQKYDRRTIWDQLEKRRKPEEPSKDTSLQLKRQKASKKRSFVANW